MKKNNLDGIKKVRFNDYTEYVEGKHNNGGCYGFWTDYTKTEDGWVVSYGTTADMEYCPCCGSFVNGNHDCDPDVDYEFVSEAELLDLINAFEETETEYVEILTQC